MPGIFSARAAITRILEPLSHGRLIRGIGANSLSQVVTICILFGSVPALLHAWGTPRYGLWLLLSAVPTYLSMGDFGFAAAAANDMTMAVSRGDTASARATHQALVLLTGVLLIGFGVLSVGAAMTVPPYWLPSTSLATHNEIKSTVALLAVSTLAALGWNSMSAALRADGKYAFGVAFNETVRLAEAAAVLSAALLGGNIVVAAAASCTVRLVALLSALFVTHARVDWVTLDLKHARVSELRRLLSPAVALMALPLGFGLALQGTTIAVGMVSSLAAVALFTSLRSLTRVATQFVGVVAHAVAPELSRAIGARDAQKIGQLVEFNTIVTGFVSALFLVFITLWGPRILQIWSHNRLNATHLLVAAFAISAAGQAVWNSSGNMLIAANRHATYSYWFVVVAAASVGSSILLGREFGIIGFAYSMIISDLTMCLIVGTKLRRAVRAFTTEDTMDEG